MKLIITGAGGLLGRGLAELAQRDGCEVVGVGRTGAPVDWTAGEWLSVDLCHPDALSRDWTIHRGAVVCHLAADTQVHDLTRDFRRDLVATETACAIARRTGGRLISISSSAVYSGASTRYPVALLKENDETNPASAYGRAKRAAEDLVLGAGLDAVVLRVFGVLSDRLGSVPDRGNLVQAILHASQPPAKLVLKTDAQGRPPVRDYAMDEDICAGILKAAFSTRNPEGESRTFNLCTGVATSTLELVELAGEEAGQRLPIQLEPKVGTENDNAVMVGDPAALRNWLGWAPASRVREFWARVAQDRAQSARSF